MGEVRTRLARFRFLSDVGPLYAIAGLWLLESGASAAEVSWLFLAWAVVALVVEVPSGALADWMDRRRLIALALGIRAAAIAVWMVWTDLPGLALGVVLWALHGSLESGAWEALVYDELSAVGEEDAYAPLMARLSQTSVVAVMVGTLAAAGLQGLGLSLMTLGWITVALNLPAIALILALPAATGAAPESPDPETGWWTTLRLGVREALAEPMILRLVVLGALIEGLFVFDDYAPVLGEVLGASNTLTSFLVVLVWVGLLLGGEVAARRPDLSPRTLALVLALTSGLSIAALASGSAWAVAALGCCYGGMQLVWVLYDARFQHRIEGTARATTTSVRAFGGALVNLSFFAFMASLGDDPTVGIALALGVLCGASLLVDRWVPQDSSQPPTATDRDAAPCTSEV